MESQSPSLDAGNEIRADIHLSGRSYTLLCKVENNGQPRLVRMASLVLRDRIERGGIDAVPILIAPYLSPASRAICEEHGIGFLESGGERPQSRSTAYSSTGRLRTSRLRNGALSNRSWDPRPPGFFSRCCAIPPRAWRVAELAETAGVSLGHASNLRKALIEREWGR